MLFNYHGPATSTTPFVDYLGQVAYCFCTTYTDGLELRMRAKFPKFFPLSLGMRQKLLFLMEQLECMVFCPVRQYSKRQKCWKNSVNCGL